MLGLSTIISLISNLFGGFKTYLYAGLAIALVAGEGYVVYKAYDYGKVSTAAQYELKLSQVAEAQAAEVKRQADANQQAQQTLQKQLNDITAQNDTLTKQIASNKQAAAKSPTARTVAVPLASVQRLRAIRGH